MARNGGAERQTSLVVMSGGESALVRIKAQPKGGVK